MSDKVWEGDKKEFVCVDPEYSTLYNLVIIFSCIAILGWIDWKYPVRVHKDAVGDHPEEQKHMHLITS